MTVKVITSVLHASGAETATDNSGPVNCRAESGAVYLNVTVASASPDTLDVTIEEFDPTTDEWYQIAAFAQILGGATTSERVALTGFFGSTLRAVWTISASPAAFTFSVGFSGESID